MQRVSNAGFLDGIKLRKNFFWQSISPSMALKVDKQAAAEAAKAVPIIPTAPSAGEAVVLAVALVAIAAPTLAAGVPAPTAVSFFLLIIMLAALLHFRQI